MRECSSRRPTIETTLMFSEMPGRPGRRQQMPRTLSSTWTPACEAAYSARMQRPSTSAFIFIAIRAGCSGECAAIVRSICSRCPSRRCSGAISTLR